MAKLKAESWWDADRHEAQLVAPRVLLASFTSAWQANAQQLTVAEKKEVFYRLMLPLVMHANEMVMARRALVLEAQERLAAGGSLSPDELAALRQGALLLRVTDEAGAAALAADSPDLAGIIDELLYRLDEIPAGLALGQAAYESGYATSRFAVEGNALFGQWAFDGQGLKPQQQRSKSHGDHRIAAFEWPFDSVRGYFINLMSHPAYEDFRRLRAELRAAGEPLSSLRLADGLLRYSERGQVYVDTLKGIIRKNGLEAADRAVFRDEPVRLAFGAANPAEAAELEAELEAMRQSGELQAMIARMRLE